MMQCNLCSAIVIGLSLTNTLTADEPDLWPGFTANSYDNEQVREIRFAEDARAIVLAPAADDFDPDRPTLLVIYATPNGNTVEQTLGCRLTDGLDWHFDIQHAAAQWRTFRALENDRNTVLACVQANNRSWPTWKGQRPLGPQIIRLIVDSLAASLPDENVRIMLTGHSGGGSFLFGYLDAAEKIPDRVERIAFLDANYGYDDSQRHGEKLLAWLDADKSHHFIVLAYDDRNIELNGKKVVSETGGTYRATHRMLDFLNNWISLDKDRQGDFERYKGVAGRLVTLLHPNPDNIILHTRLVGEMNGLLEVLTIGTRHYGKWGSLTNDRAYTKAIQAQPFTVDPSPGAAPYLQARRPGALGGSSICNALLESSPPEREATILHEVLHGNVPDFWRSFVEIPVEWETAAGQKQRLIYRVAPDYLSVGSDEDFVRIPLTPYIAQQLADMVGCVLPTRKMVNDVYRAAPVKLAPQPLTEAREALATFVEHNGLIQQQWQSPQLGHLVAGIKKDVVLTNLLLEKPGHVAIYGWHKRDGQPIQPLTTVHVDWYVDYSHGIRFVDQWAILNDEPVRVSDLLSDPDRCAALSDEGPLECVSYRRPTAE